MSVFFTLMLILLGTATPIFAGDTAFGHTESPSVQRSLSPIPSPPSDNVPAVSRWMDPSNQPRLKHDVRTTAEPFHIKKVAPSSLKSAPMGLNGPAPSSGRICIVVHHDVYDLILEGLGQYEADLAAMGYETTTLVYFSGPPEALRAYLAQMYAEAQSLVGAVFLGEIPYVLFEMYDSISDPPYTDFPCDLFFMDLNGEWSDSRDEGEEVRAGNGKYDTWAGNQDLEIWVCRLMPANLIGLNTADLPPAYFQAYLLNSYFSKNHRYRVGSDVPLYTGLVYNDDPWAGLGPEDVGNLERVFGTSNVLSEWTPETTTKQDYLNIRLPSSPQLILLRSHGYSGGHIFFPDSEFVTLSDYDAVDPRTPFFSLYVCSGSDYTAENNLSGTIALDPDGLGLLAWGSTKTGGMWNDGAFYEALALGHVFGEAFRLWLNEKLKLLNDPGYKDYYKQFILGWWSGMVLTGDAALKPVTASSPTGSLTVNLFPPEAVGAGAQWNVDGGIWHNSGDTVEGLSVLGEHTIHFKQAPDWVSPHKQGVVIANGLLRSVSSNYSSASGILAVTIEPQAAIDAGARWRVDGGTWLRSGTPLSGISVGPHAIEFKDIPAWAKPLDQTVNIEIDQTTNSGGIYVQQRGSLTVSIGPPDAIGDGAKWRVDSGSWQQDGFSVIGISVGPHVVEFESIPGWTKPANKIVTVVNELTTSTSGTYALITGTLAVTITPQEAINAGAQWSVNGGATWNDSGALVDLPAGEYTVTFKDIAAWSTPASLSVTLASGVASQIDGSYTPLLSAEFSATPPVGKTPLRVTFTANSTGTVKPTKWLWDFGDGGTSTRQNPVYNYRKAGNYTVSLTVTAADGTTSVRVYSDYINAYTAPKSNFTATSTRGKDPPEVSFSNKSTGSITKCEWEFGDGGMSSDPNPVHTYARPGNYKVRLRVFGPADSHDDSSRRITALK